MTASVQDCFFGLLCLGALLANLAIFRARASQYAADDAAMFAEATAMLRAARRYLGGLIVVGTMGALFGLSGWLLTPLRGSATNLSWFDIGYSILYASVFLRATWWVFREGGAERLAKHHEMFRFAPSSELGVMFIWILLVLALGYAWVLTVTGAA